MSEQGDPASRLGPAAPAPGPAAARSRGVLLEPLQSSPDVIAAWEQGSAGFGRADLASDVDLVVLVRDGRTESVLDELDEAVRARLEQVAVQDVPGGRFGHQRTWLPSLPDGDGERTHALMDVAAIEHVAQEATWRAQLHPEQHGRPLVLHDPHGVVEAALRDRAPFEAAALRTLLADELRRIRQLHAVTEGFVEKELGRGREADAHGFHRSLVVAPLVTLLNVRHRPLRHGFGLRYLHDELPPEVVERLLPIIAPQGSEELARAAAGGRAWIASLLASIDPAALPIEVHSASMRRTFG